MMSLHRYATAVAILFTTVLLPPGAAAQATLDPEQLRIPHEKFVLPNGLTLLVQEDHSVPIVAVNLWYHVGSRNEKRGRTGFAHLFEHFFFNGSENYPHGFREAMDDLGANNRNGTTDTDRTNFFEDVPVSALERTLYLEADRMGFLAGNLSEAMLERERGVVQNEKRQGENQPYGRVFSRMVETIYPAAHPYSWSTIGSMEDLNAATLADIKDWYRQYYNPNNVVLTLAGDITPQRALELVTRYFGSIPAGPPLERHEAWVPTFDRNVREVMEDRVPQARIYRVWHAPPWGDRELLHLSLLASVLSGTKSSPLDRALVYDKELATGVSAAIWTKELASNVLITVTVKPGVDPAAAERELDAVLGRVLEQGPTKDELQRAQSRILAAFARGLERLGGFGGRADVLAESMTYGGDPEAYLQQLKTLASATPLEVRDAGRKWLRANHYTMTVLPFGEYKTAQNDLDRKVLPALGAPPDVKLPDVQRAKLSNGLNVLLLERHSAPLVNVALAVDAGYASDLAGKTGAAALAVDLLDDGTRTRSAFQITDELDRLGAQIVPGSTVDMSTLRLRALRPTLEPALQLFADVALNPAYPQEIVDLEKRRQIARIAQEQATPASAALRLIPTLLYPEEHAYAKPLTGSGYAPTVSAIARQDLVDWHRAWFQPGSSTIVVTGDVTLPQLMPMLEKSFGSWKAGTAPSKNLAATSTRNAGKVFLVDRPGAPQTVIAAAHLSEPGGHPQDLAIEMVMTLFGGMATSRLNRNLRLEKHWSYGTQGQLLAARGQRPLLVIAPVQTDKTKESIREVVKELRDITGARPVRGEEFESIKRNMVSRLAGRYETLAALENTALNMVNVGYPESYLADYARNLRALSEADLANAASTFIQPDQVVWVIVGDLARIETGIRELNLGEVVRLEGEAAPTTAATR